MKDAFRSVRHWVFDLDNTLYPPAARLFDQIEQRMVGFVMRTLGVDRQEADRLRTDYWRDHGTTLAGLMHHHTVDADAFLQDVHDIDFDALEPDPHLAELIDQLPGRKIVYTNGSAPYAARVLQARGLADAFDAIYGVEDADYTPKPQRSAFETVFAKASVEPSAAAMFEDDPRNLAAPRDMGLRTVLVGPDPLPDPHIQHHTSDLNAFLGRLR